MPTYQAPRHGARLSFEYLESMSVSPLQRAMLQTLELYHPLSGRRRFVKDEQDLIARLEVDAPEHGGELVEFVAAPLTTDRPEQSADGSAPEMSISLDAVAGLMAPEFDKARGSIEPWVVTERMYASDDLDGPAVLPPSVYEVSNSVLQGAVLGLRASFGDAVNVAVPARTFTRAKYPGLQR